MTMANRKYYPRMVRILNHWNKRSTEQLQYPNKLIVSNETAIFDFFFILNTGSSRALWTVCTADIIFWDLVFLFESLGCLGCACMCTRLSRFILFAARLYLCRTCASNIFCVSFVLLLLLFCVDLSSPRWFSVFGAVLCCWSALYSVRSFDSVCNAFGQSKLTLPSVLHYSLVFRSRLRSTALHIPMPFPNIHSMRYTIHIAHT